MSSSPAKGTTAIFIESCGNFTKANKQAFLDHLHPIKNLLSSLNNPIMNDLADRLKEGRHYGDTNSLLLPSSLHKEIFIRNSVLSELRSCCVALLDSLPEKQDHLIRKFLIDTEEFLAPKISPRSHHSAPAPIQPKQMAFGT